MPKENVSDTVANELRAEIGWSSGYVQVATTNANSTLQIDDPLPDGAATESFKGWHVTLDREGCNRLIRVVRRARDAAFGSDA